MSDGDEREFTGFSGGFEFEEEGFENRVFANGDEACQVKKAAGGSTAASDVSFATHGATVVVDGGKAGEFGDGTAAEGAEFRQIADQAQSATPIQAGHFIQALGLLPEWRMGVAQGEQLLFEFEDLAIEKADGAFELGLQPRVFALVPACLLGGSTKHQMIARGEELGQALKVLWLLRGGGWFVGFAKGSEDLRIQPVGLGEKTTRAGKITTPARVDDTDRQCALMAMRHQFALVAAGGLTDEVEGQGAEFLQTGIEASEASGRIGNGEGLIEETAVDGRFGDIGPAVDRVGVHRIGMAGDDVSGFGSALSYELGRDREDPDRLRQLFEFRPEKNRGTSWAPSWS